MLAKILIKVGVVFVFGFVVLWFATGFDSNDEKVGYTTNKPIEISKLPSPKKIEQ